MWVFCCGMYRSASTLQFQITTRLVKDAGMGQTVGWIDAKRFPEVRSSYTGHQGLKVVKVHLCTDSIASEFMHNNAIGIYTFRDIRDVYASFMKQRMKSFEYLWNEGLIEFCLNNYKRWTTLPNVLVSRYEHIMPNVSGEVKRIADHLHISTKTEQYETIASEYSTEVQQERIQRFKNKLMKTQRDPNDHREIFDYHDEETLLHINHIDSGKINRWKDDLSPNQIRRIEERVQDWCIANCYSSSVFFTDSLLFS